MGLAIYTFWELVKNIDRIRAEEDQRTLLVVGAAFGGSGGEVYRQLQDEQGEPYQVEDSGIDKDSIFKLRSVVESLPAGQDEEA